MPARSLYRGTNRHIGRVEFVKRGLALQLLPIDLTRCLLVRLVLGELQHYSLHQHDVDHVGHRDELQGGPLWEVGAVCE